MLVRRESQAESTADSQGTGNPTVGWTEAREAPEPQGEVGKTLSRSGKAMKVYYDHAVDALYLKLGDEKPDGVVEISEGVNLDTTSAGKLVGIEILQASAKLDLSTILNYSLELDQDLLGQEAP